MFNNWKLRDRLSAGYALPVIIFVLFNGQVLQNSNLTSDTVSKGDSSRDLILNLDNMTGAFSAMSQDIKTSLLAGYGYSVTSSADTLSIDSNAFDSAASNAGKIIKDFPKDQQDIYAQMLKIQTKFQNSAKSTLQLNQSAKSVQNPVQNKEETQGKTDPSKQQQVKHEQAKLAQQQKDSFLQASQSFEKDSYQDIQEFRSLDLQLRKKILDDLADQTKSTTNSLLFIKITSVIVPIVSLIVAFAVAYAITIQIEKLILQVKKSSLQVTDSTTSIAASGKQLEATMTERAASTSEVTATAKEIAATSEQLVKTMDEVERRAELTAQSAGNSQKELRQMEQSMRQLADATLVISTKLGVISDKAGNINNIVNTITKVADQTNLLSLNAAIEAEKAGEYGTGFAVVAREIRRLADQTAVATLDIENMVKEMQGAVSTGVMEMDKFSKEVKHSVDNVANIGEKLASIIQQVQNLTPRFQKVSSSVGGQSQGAVQISQAMAHLSDASSDTINSLFRINQAIDHLNESAQNLRQGITQFNIDGN